MRYKTCDMLNQLVPAAIILLLVAVTSTTLLVRDINASRLRGRVGALRSRSEEQALAIPVRSLGIRSAGQRGEHAARLMRLLRFNPDIPLQNIVPWKVVFVVAFVMALAGFFYGRAFLGWPLATAATPIEAFLVARFIFVWERARFQKALLEQIPDVMALICRAVSAGIPLSEALRNVARDAPRPSRDEFVHVVSAAAIGQPLDRALWSLHERVGLAEYAFFAVTIGLQAQTGGSLVETLQNLQDMVRKRIALSKRGKALAAEARMSAIILGAMPLVLAFILFFARPEAITFFFITPTGNHLLLVAFGLMGTGIMAIRLLIRRSLAP
jgi:tight adherence protein B